jgi:3-dehydroquinate synthase
MSSFKYSGGQQQSILFATFAVGKTIKGMTSIYFDTEAVEALGKFAAACKSKNRNIVVLCDKNTEKHCLALLKSYVPSLLCDCVIAISAGEEHKNIQTVNDIWEQLLEKDMDKNAVLISLGGGVVCDLGGFVSATFKRGIEHVPLPTSLMAQIDASIGGKTGFNVKHAKNQVGVFNFPKHNFIIPAFLKTLPQKEVWSGFMEMLKHGLIADKAYWDTLIRLQSPSQITTSTQIRKSVEIKTNICSADPFEENERKKLNFGHTIAHALEACLLAANRPLSHGEAVGVGMLAEAYISCEKSLLDATSFSAIAKVLSPLIGEVVLKDIPQETFLHYINKDKKKTGTLLNFTLLDSIGNARINQTVSDSEILSAWRYLQTNTTT